MAKPPAPKGTTSAGGGVSLCVRRAIVRASRLGRKLVAQASLLAAGNSNSSRPRNVVVSDSTWLILGLGNPGRRYAQTRHNIGFVVLDALVERLAKTSLHRVEHNAHVWGPVDAAPLLAQDDKRRTTSASQVLLAKPQTFMNASGEAVIPLGETYGIPPSRWLVVVDDLDLETAELRMKPKGSSTQNGMRSIAACLDGNTDFARLRVGISRPPKDSGISIVEYVLGEWTDEEAVKVSTAVDEAASLIGDAVHGGPLTAKVKV